MAIFNLTLRTRIYLSMLAIILLSFLVSGGIAIYDHYQQAETNNLQRLLRKEDGIKTSMEYFLYQHEGFIRSDSIPYFFADKICELSEVHQMFIGLFDLKGNYLISSGSAKMDSLGIPYKINYTILKQLATIDGGAVIDKTWEHEGHTLGYWYFTDDLGKPIAITNVAYKKEEVSEDLKVFLQDLGQSYILLFLIASLVAYLLSTYITRSLEKVKERMQQVQLGSNNQPLVWEGHDEIGSLVKEYNRMIVELDRSAELLAQEERESAWREMAKQVAHEIKNPLTPMKLRVQYLQKAWMDGAGDFDGKLKLFSQSMTEQIDTLSRIASEFSDFAKMPRPNQEKLNLTQLIQGVVELYSSHIDVQIEVRLYALNDSTVYADRDQVLRVMNNLLTNAIQAMDSDTKGKIDIAIRGYKSQIIVRIQDNGSGIPKDKYSRIFTPNFTTKSTGTGLGLAMVRNIMHLNGGGVWFWSKEGHGTSFYLSFSKGNFQ
jgi:two-component system, NtrC family, nitrogen regulation sensor histidine kinase NtrY